MAKRKRSNSLNSLIRFLSEWIDKAVHSLIQLVTVIAIIAGTLLIVSQLLKGQVSLVYNLIQVCGVIVALLPILITGLIKEKAKIFQEFIIAVLQIEYILLFSLLSGVIFYILGDTGITTSNMGWTSVIYGFSGLLFGFMFLFGIGSFVYAINDFRTVLAKKFKIKLDEDE